MLFSKKQRHYYRHYRHIADIVNQFQKSSNINIKIYHISLSHCHYFSLLNNFRKVIISTLSPLSSLSLYIHIDV